MIGISRFIKGKRLENKLLGYNNTFKASIKRFQPGEIPEVLKYDRPYEIGKLSNGVQVYSERWPSPLATILVFLNCGSRNETPETSGAAHFLEHLHFKGTSKRKREQLELDVENMGGQLNAYTSRENTSYNINAFKQNVPEALEILGDMLLNSTYDNSYLMTERNTIYAELLETQKDQMEALVEHAHFNIYKDHMIGKPILGRIENLPNVRRDMIVNFHSQNYVGENIIVLGVGDMPEHAAFMELVNRHFGHYPAKAPFHQRIKPKFHPGISLVKPDLLENPPDGVNVGVFFEAANWKDPDYYSFLILQRLIGDKPQHELEAKIFVQDGSTNIFQNRLAGYNNILFQQSLFTPYMDCGIFGNYFYGDPESFEDMLDLTKGIFERYGKGEITDMELDRAKNKLFIEILQHETGNDLSQAYGNQLLYLKRRVHRSEIAKRIADHTKEDIARAVEKWLLNKPHSVTAWGNVGHLEKKYRLVARSSITQ